MPDPKLKPAVEVQVGFNNVAKTTGGNRAAYGYATDEKGNVIPNTNMTLVLPNSLLDLSAAIDPDKTYVLTLQEVLKSV